MISKYQFYISFNEKHGTAAAKAIQDCTVILKKAGYRDFNCIVSVGQGKKYLLRIAACLIKLLFLIQPGSIIAVQYPLLSGNAFFKYFIKMAHLRKAKVFCIIHDLDELRYNVSRPTSKDVLRLNHYDYIITHNEVMTKWLLEKGLTRPMIELEVFDYLSGQEGGLPVSNSSTIHNKIVFAGNLSKSDFIYSLERVPNWFFNLYGSSFLLKRAQINVRWNGSLQSEEILEKLDGDFGLIWDGGLIDDLDNVFGNYLKYNNPHKLSLYLAAGLPVIAPKTSAVSEFISKHNIGILIDNLMDLNSLSIDNARYSMFKNNVMSLQHGIKTGNYFSAAIKEVETFLAA
jgi:hypothetical protein